MPETFWIHVSDEVSRPSRSYTHTLRLLLPRRRGWSHSLLDIALLLASGTIPHAVGLNILGIRRWRSEMTSAAWVGQGVWARERRSFLRVGGVSDVGRLHDCVSEVSMKDSRRLKVRCVGDDQMLATNA